MGTSVGHLRGKEFRDEMAHFVFIEQISGFHGSLARKGLRQMVSSIEPHLIFFDGSKPSTCFMQLLLAISL